MSPKRVAGGRRSIPRPSYCRTCGERLEWFSAGRRQPPVLACPAGHHRRPEYLSPAPRAVVRARRLEPAGSIRVARREWGLAPTLTLVAAMGLLLVSIGFQRAAENAGGGNELFWAGSLIMFAPIAARLSMARVSRRETIALLVVLAVFLYLTKVLHSPFYFTFHDEFIHWRTTDDIVRTGRLFEVNPLLPASSTFPALEAATAAVVQLSGLSIYHAGLVAIGLARLVFVLALYLSFERLSRSRRIGAFSAVVYMTNANFVFFNASFKYETVALAFCSLCILATIIWARADDRTRPRVFILAAITAFAAVASHHLSAVALVVLLGGWSLVTKLLPASSRTGWRPPWPLFWTTAGMTAVWLVVIAPVTFKYLAPVIQGALAAGGRLLGERLGFLESTGTVRQILPTDLAPSWERVVAIVSVALITIALGAGAWQVLRRYRRSPFVVAFTVALPAYPASLLLRLTDAGWETANRSSEFLYVALALPIALGILVLAQVVGRSRVVVIALVTGALFIGGVRSGWRFEDRLPEPYLCCHAPRAIEPEGIAAGEWASRELGPGTRIGGDRAVYLLLGSYGRQQVMTTVSGGINPNWVLFAPTFDDDKIDLLRRGRVSYLAVDERVATNPDEYSEYLGDTPIGAALAKFDSPLLDPVYDAGAIRIFNVERLWIRP